MTRDAVIESATKNSAWESIRDHGTQHPIVPDSVYFAIQSRTGRLSGYVSQAEFMSLCRHFNVGLGERVNS